MHSMHSPRTLQEYPRTCTRVIVLASTTPLARVVVGLCWFSLPGLGLGLSRDRFFFFLFLAVVDWPAEGRLKQDKDACWMQDACDAPRCADAPMCRYLSI